ncbi:amidase signature domain-containing protein [Blastocladiella britannica]|nr:amidase signature domain-containing protein [Blastocladiella britannica]
MAASLTSTLRALRSGTTSPVAVLDRAWTAIATHNAHCNALTHIAPRADLERAATAAAQRYANGSARPLEGVPVAIKGNFATANDLPTTCGSRVLADYVSPFDATAVARLRAAGAIVMGKSNLDEFGMGSFNIHSVHGPCVQPGPDRRVAGGSSGGSAVAVQTGMALAALGSDTGGSVRLPASYCGVVGWKPQYGAVSRHGLVAYAHSLDTVGVLARTVPDARLVYDQIAGPDPLDMTSTKVTAHDLLPPSLVIGVPSDYHLQELTPAAIQTWSAALTKLEAAGHTVRRVELPSTLSALAAYYVLAPAEAASNLARFDGVRYGRHRTQLGPEVQRRLLVGAYALSARAVDTYYARAVQVRAAVAREFAAAFAECHVLVTPAALGAAPLLADVPPTTEGGAVRKGEEDPAAAYVNDVFTVPASLAGLPAIVVPVTDHIGVQVVGPRDREQWVLDVGQMVDGGVE